MKKFEVRSLLAFLLAAMMVFTLAACGDGNDTLPPDSETTDPVETDPTETDPVETDPVETDPVETDPVETDPPATEPVETDPPVTEPVETEPPVTEPVETDPPATEPAVTDCKHDYGSGKKVNATCQSEGGTEYTCRKCGETKLENVTPKVDHLYTTVILSTPGCVSDGESAEQCVFCGSVLSTQVVGSYGHDYTTREIESISPTHHKAEITVCVRCDDIASAKGTEEHQFASVALAPDDVTEVDGIVTYGFETFECSVCGYVREVMSNHASGHYYEAEPTTGKYICACGHTCIGDYVHNGNENAGPVVSVQD